VRRLPCGPVKVAPAHTRNAARNWRGALRGAIVSSMADLAKDERGTRSYKIRAFLAKPPKRAECLRLHTEGEDTELTVGVWEDREAWRPELAAEIQTAAETHAYDESASVVRLKLVFEDASKHELKGIRIVHKNEDNPAQLMSAASELTGSQTSQVMQAQRHMEALMRLVMDSQVKIIAQQRETTQHALDMCASLAARIAETEGRERDAQAKADEFRAMAEKLSESPDAEKEKGVADFIEIVRPMLPFVMQALAKTPTPPTGG